MKKKVSCSRKLHLEFTDTDILSSSNNSKLWISLSYRGFEYLNKCYPRTHPTVEMLTHLKIFLKNVIFEPLSDAGAQDYVIIVISQQCGHCWHGDHHVNYVWGT